MHTCGVCKAVSIFMKGESLTCTAFVAHILKIHVRVVALEEKKTGFILQITKTKYLLRLKLQAVSLVSPPACVLF